MVVHAGKDEMLAPSDGSGTTDTNTGSPVYQNTVWSVKCQVRYKALFAPERNLGPQNSTLNPIAVVVFNFELYGAQKLWRLNFMFGSVLQMAARLPNARSDFTSAKKT